MSRTATMFAALITATLVGCADAPAESYGLDADHPTAKEAGEGWGYAPMDDAMEIERVEVDGDFTCQETTVQIAALDGDGRVTAEATRTFATTGPYTLPAELVDADTTGVLIRVDGDCGGESAEVRIHRAAERPNHMGPADLVCPDSTRCELAD